MACAMCLHFSMQAEDILEHIRNVIGNTNGNSSEIM